MTRRDYEEIAEILAQSQGRMPEDAHRELCENFAARLALGNFRFNKRLFLSACGVSEIAQSENGKKS